MSLNYDVLLDGVLETIETSVVQAPRPVHRGRGFSHGDLHYPALSVPIGQADELVCSPNHVEFLQERLEASQPLHLLMVGYSGNDREVMALIRASGRGIKTLTVVGRSQEAAEAVIGRIARDHGVRAEFTYPYAGTFDDFVGSGALAAYVDDMSQRPF